MTLSLPSLVDTLLMLLGLSVWIGKGADVGPVGVTPVDIVVVLLFIVVAARSAFRTRATDRPSGTARPGLELLVLASLVLIVCSALISVIHATEPTAIVRFAGRYVLGAMLVTSLLVLLRDGRRIRVLLESLLTGAVLSVALSAAGLLFPPFAAITVRYGDRAQALLNHPNQFAMLLVSLIPVALALALRNPKQMGAWLVITALAVGVGLTGSKLNLVLAVVALAVTSLLASQLHRRLTKRIGLSLGLTVGTLVLAYLTVMAVQAVSPRTLETIVRLFQEPEQVTAVVTRVEMWDAAIQLGLDHPWTGIGAGNAIHYIPYDHAHNVFIEFFMTLGVPGLIALLLFLTTLLVISGLAIWTALTARRSMAPGRRLLIVALPVSLLGYVLANQSSDSFGGTTLPILWLLLSVLLVLLKLPHLGRRPALRPQPLTNEPEDPLGVGASEAPFRPEGGRQSQPQH